MRQAKGSPLGHLQPFIFQAGGTLQPAGAGADANGPVPLGYLPLCRVAIFPRDTMRRQDTLDLRINTVYDLPLDGELELNVTAKSNDQVVRAPFQRDQTECLRRGRDLRRETPRLLRMADRKQAGW